MRAKKSQAKRKPRPKKVISAPAAEVAVPVPPKPPSTYPLSFSGGPPPEALALEAESERDDRELGQYIDSIRILRGKRFSYREIAEWLSERGVPADHNEVYRVYTKSLSDYHAALEAEQEAEEEREEALRNV